MKFSIGADPEVFLGDDTGVRSVIGKIGGTKQCPLPMPIGEGFAVQEDNVALEFNIPACNDRAAFVEAIAKATGFLQHVLKERNGLSFDKRSAVSFPEAEFYDPAAFIFGCEPDYNAWTKMRNPRPTCSDKALRSCGGHIHIGFTGYDHHEVVKGMDLFAGVPSILMDKGELRKQLYGKAGAFRRTHYGVEYRPLSNFWIFDPALCGWAYDAVSRTLEACEAGMDFNAEKDRILHAIDGNDKEVAMKLVKEYNLNVVYA